MRFAILKNESDENYVYWSKACRKHNHVYEIINLTDYDWLNKIMFDDYPAFLVCPPGRESLLKQMYDERAEIIETVVGGFLYPALREIRLHENKRYLSYWLEANDIAHPKTYVFYNSDQAHAFIKNCQLPIVGKFNIGASGKGVVVFRDRTALSDYIEKAFIDGIRQQWGPNIAMGDWIPRIKGVIKKPSRILERLKVYKKVYFEKQKGFVILQEYIPHDYEWRVVKIGNSFFGHQKVKQKDKASGTKGIDYIIPPDKLLAHVKTICEKFGFNTMSVDVFEDEQRGFLINEMQCVFGHVQEYICAKNDKPGRLVYLNGSWTFEEGLFNSNLSFDLRMQNVLEILKINK